MVSEKHANFIQADPGGSADDVRALIGIVQEEVSLRLGVHLIPEVRFLGFEQEQGS
jgi:UDP-N-acetylmuramate dehydrogenase